MSILDEVSKYRTDIQFDTYTTTWRELLGQFKDEELIIDPDFQRLFRWSADQQTQYVESILLGIPSPPLFLAQNKDGRAEVIDGLQRVSTLVKFFASEVFEQEAVQTTERAEEDVNDIRIPSLLEAGPIVRTLEGYSAETLPESLVRTIKYARITIILLEKESSTRARYEVFRRLNKFGSPLSDQEIRNCTSRLFDSQFPAKLREIASKPAVRDALSLNEDAERSMGKEEMILRLLAFNFSATPLRHEIREYLDDFMVYAAEGKFSLTPEVEAKVESTFKLIRDAGPEGVAFRFPRGGFSTNLFDVVATGVFANLERLNVDRLRTRLTDLLASDDIKAVTGAGSNTRKKLEGRLDLGKRWFG
jgi:hypothetical protein